MKNLNVSAGYVKLGQKDLALLQNAKIRLRVNETKASKKLHISNYFSWNNYGKHYI